MILAKIGLLSELSIAYQQTKPDSAYKYANILLELSRKLDYRLSEVFGYSRMAYALLDLGQYPKQLQAIQGAMVDRYAYIEEPSSISMTPRLRRLQVLADLLQVNGILYTNMEHYRKEISLDSQVLALRDLTGNFSMKYKTHITMSIAYSRLGMNDKVLILLVRNKSCLEQLGNKKALSEVCF